MVFCVWSIRDTQYAIRVAIRNTLYAVRCTFMQNKAKQSQLQTLPCKIGSSRVSTVEVISLECTIGHYGEIFAGQKVCCIDKG